MAPRRALITGITGQDGSYLAELLQGKGYSVVGVTSGGASRANLGSSASSIEWEEGSIADRTFVDAVLMRHRPDEIYNLASVATVAHPWNDLDAIISLTGMAPVHFLENIRTNGYAAKFFQASSAEMFGEPSESPQRETTPLAPRNPYGVSKAFAHQFVSAYRRDHGMFAVSGILFNHESLRRPTSFLTRKITAGLAALKAGKGEVLRLGNLDSVRDWGYAKEYVEAMWRMLQQPEPKDYVIATGKTHTVRECVEAAARALDLPLTWQGTGVDEVGLDADDRIIVSIDPAFYRRPESVVRVGDATKIAAELGWEAQVPFDSLISMMAKADYNRLLHE